jgi:LacI family transcriptional regulator
MVIKKRAITIRDVAKEAGVSYQTVSRVINDSQSVAEETRRRVQKAMQDLDYRPNKVAQMLTTNRSSSIEVLIVDVSYGGRLADSTKNMAHTAKQAGYHLLVSEASSENLAESFASAAARLVDGIIMYAPRLQIEDDELLELSLGLPFVRRDYVPHSSLAWVGFDQAFATRLAVEHLIKLGHKKIAAIPPDWEIINGYWRWKTWENVMREHGLEPRLVVGGDYSMRGAYDAAKQILSKGESFTGLIVGTDNMAVGAMRALREAGLRIPDDVSVVGFDNAEVSNFTEPPLTTVDFKFDKQDEMVVKYLLELIADPEMELHHRVLMSSLITRESSRKL